MKNDDKASISLKKIISISILFVFIMSAAVFAGNVKLNNVKIILASGYEMNVLTSKTKIADILDDNHINRMPMITTNRIKLKMDLTIDDFMARLNHFVDEVWEFGAVLYQQLGGNIEAINIELGKFEFSFGGIVVKPLYMNTGEMIFQYSFSRFFCQSLKGDAMYAYVERYKDI